MPGTDYAVTAQGALREGTAIMGTFRADGIKISLDAGH
jgi:hypothetical protein